MTRVLLVEDHEEIWDFLSRRLKRRGYDVILATDGQQAVDKARAERPDIILLDMNLPIIDGWTAASMIKSSPEAGRVPIIALTAHAMTGDREHCLAAGCDDYATKPIDPHELVLLISRRVRARHSVDDVAAALPTKPDEPDPKTPSASRPKRDRKA